MTKKKMWGGRFKEKIDPDFWQFSGSLDYDKVLLEYDIKGSIAHVKMLSKCNIIPKKKAASIEKALSAMLKDYQQGKLKIDPNAEDVHTAVLIALSKRIGKILSISERREPGISPIVFFPEERFNLSKKSSLGIVGWAISSNGCPTKETSMPQSL